MRRCLRRRRLDLLARPPGTAGAAPPDEVDTGLQARLQPPGARDTNRLEPGGHHQGGEGHHAVATAHRWASGLVKSCDEGFLGSPLRPQILKLIMRRMTKMPSRHPGEIPPASAAAWPRGISETSAPCMSGRSDADHRHHARRQGADDEGRRHRFAGHRLDLLAASACGRGSRSTGCRAPRRGCRRSWPGSASTMREEPHLGGWACFSYMLARGPGPSTGRPPRFSRPAA